MSICHHNRTESDCPTCSKFYSNPKVSKVIPVTKEAQGSEAINNNVNPVWFEYRNRLARTVNIVLIVTVGLTIIIAVITAVTK